MNVCPSNKVETLLLKIVKTSQFRLPRTDAVHGRKLRASMKLARGLSSVLSSASGERAPVRWLKKNPLVLCHAVCTVPVAQYVVPELSLVGNHKADFVVLAPSSGGWEVHFVELEPPDEKLFTRAGNPARRLQAALTQVEDWRSAIEKNRNDVIRELVESVKERDLLWDQSDDEPSDNCGRNLSDSQSVIEWHHHVIIGRRAALTRGDAARKASYWNHHRVEIMTYDRLIEAATMLDQTDRAFRNPRLN